MMEKEENLPDENTPSTGSGGEGLGFESRLPLDGLKSAVDQVKSELNKVIVGQESFIELLLVALLANGHVLIEGVPGIAKTLTAKLFSKTLDTGFSRIQFTPDLMPSDVLGTSVLNMKSSQFEFRPGPVFSNIVLIDEINRAPAKTQAALFEVMEERQVTLDGTRFEMDYPFMVLATQNPIEQEGTYALPEAQLDRFLFKIDVDYPTLEEEIGILKTHDERRGEDPSEKIQRVLAPERLRSFRKLSSEVLVEEKVLRYIAEIVSKTRNHPHLFLGASPRASISMMNAAKAFAATAGRDYVIPEDVKKTVKPVLCHRVILTPEREMEGLTSHAVVDSIVQSIPVPR